MTDWGTEINRVLDALAMIKCLGTCIVCYGDGLERGGLMDTDYGGRGLGRLITVEFARQLAL